MGVLKWILGLAEKNRDVLLDIVRIYLGVGLLVKGLFFITDKAFVTEMLLDTGGELRFIDTALAHYVPLAHIGGGAMLAAGLLTRVAVLFQLPVLAGAAFLFYQQEGLLTRTQNFDFTALVLFLLVILLFHGSGRLSLDHHIVRNQLRQGD